MMHRLKELPIANGTPDQAQEQVRDFYSVWRAFRVQAMKCDKKGWLKQTFYNTDLWKNYDALKKQSTKYRTWKQRDNQRRWREMPEDQRERRRKKQREAAAETRKIWFDRERAFGLAKRCLRADSKATTITYQPVLRLIRKHVSVGVSERFMIDCVKLAIACLLYDPNDPASVEHLESTLHWCCAPGPDQASRDLAEKRKRLWRQYAQETWEASDKPGQQEVLDHV